MERLTDSDQSFITLCLGIAAKSFDAHANQARAARWHDLVTQFERQATEIRALCTRITNAAAVALITEDE